MFCFSFYWTVVLLASSVCPLMEKAESCISLLMGGTGGGKSEMFGWHHQLDGDEFEQALGVGDGQGSNGVAKSWIPLSELNWGQGFAQ